MRRILLNVVLLVAAVGSTAVAQRGTPPGKKINVSGTFPTMQLVPTVSISQSKLDVATIKAISVSPNGMLVVNDRDEQLFSFSATTQARALIGRHGSGPGEYQRFLSMAWKHDTLAVLDRQLRRLSYFGGADLHILKSFPLHLPTPVNVVTEMETLIGSGAAAALIVARRPAPPKRGPVKPGAPPVKRPDEISKPPEHGIFSITGAGPDTTHLTAMDTLPIDGADCFDAAGYIHIYDPYFPIPGPRRALTTSGELLSIDPNTFSVTIRGGLGRRNDVLVDAAFPFAAISNTVWDSVSAEYRKDKATAATHGGMRGCSSSMERPPHQPAIRAIQLDEQNRLWIEVMEASGIAMRVLTLDGKTVGRFTMPARDERVPWVVRNNRLYMVLKDKDDVQSIQVYDVRQ